jgi:hypothetical protein
MSSDTTRRDFLKHTAVVAGSLPAALSISGVAAASSLAIETRGNVLLSDGDLLRALGERIGLEAAERVAPNGEAVSLMYFDYAGVAIDPLRAGIEHGLAWHCATVSTNELSMPYGALLGVAIVRNLETARETRIEIDAAALSQLAMIEANAPSRGIAKLAMMNASPAFFYRDDVSFA